MSQNITYTDPTVGLIPNVGVGSAAMNRWLKLFNSNPVTKIFGYIPIPALVAQTNEIFQINAQWDYQTISPLISAAINNPQYIVTSNNGGPPVNVPNPSRVFTLNVNELNNLLSSLLCTICIRYNVKNPVTGNITTYRYRLNNPQNHVGLYAFEPVPYPDYNGEVIFPYFSIECWSNNDQDATISIPAEIDITTSIFNLVQDSFDPTNNSIIPPQNTTQLLSTELPPNFDMLNPNFTFPWSFPVPPCGNNN